MSKPTIVFVGALLAAGCGGQEKDSNRAEGLATFVLSTPDLTIGQLEGQEHYLLSHVSDATRLSDGSIVVANCLTAEVRWFDAQGHLLRSAGGHGQGPAEFIFLRRLFPAGGDSVGAFDPFNNRVTIFAPDGDVTTIDLARAGRAEVLGRLGNGLFVARRYLGPPMQARGERGRSTTPLLLVDSEGSVVDSIPALDDADFLVPRDVGRPVAGLRLGRAAVFAVVPDGIFYGAQDDRGIIKFDPSLTKMGVTETITRGEVITDADKAQFQEMLDAGAHVAGLSGPFFPRPTPRWPPPFGTSSADGMPASGLKIPRAPASIRSFGPPIVMESWPVEWRFHRASFHLSSEQIGFWGFRTTL